MDLDVSSESDVEETAITISADHKRLQNATFDSWLVDMVSKDGFKNDDTNQEDATNSREAKVPSPKWCPSF